MSQSGRKDGKAKRGVVAFYKSFVATYLLKACALIGMFVVTGLAQAAWPDKPVTFIVPLTWSYSPLSDANAPPTAKGTVILIVCCALAICDKHKINVITIFFIYSSCCAFAII